MSNQYTDFIQRGYTVKETAPVYFSADMDKTMTWFEKTLGWYCSVDERDADGNGMYGCVFDIPPEFGRLNIAPFRGIHILGGEPKGGKVSLIHVEGIGALHERVTKSGWTEITAVNTMPWARTCCVTTPDGYELEFFEG